MASLEGTIIRCGTDCNCGGHNAKILHLEGTAVELMVRSQGVNRPHRVSVFELLRLVGGTVR